MAGCGTHLSAGMWEAETKGSQVQSLPELHSEFKVT